MSKYGNAAYLEGIPDEWNCLPLKRCFHISKRIAGELGYDVLSITQRGLRVRDITDFKGQLSSDYSKYQIVEPGDFAMNHMDLLTGWIDCSEQLGVTSPDYRVFKIDRDEFDKRYFLYFFQSCYNLRIFYGFGRGVSGMGRWRLPADQFNNMMIPVPTPAIQKAIADYLDVKCASIDKSIEAAEASIEEYKLYKKSVIFQAVTKGLDPNEPMKDSGIEHLDSIPAHWAVRPVKSLMSFSKGINILKTDLCDEGEPCVTYGEAHGRLAFSFDADRDYIRRAPLRFTVGGEKSIVYTGDFIFADTSEDIAGSGDFTFNAGRKPVFAGYHSVVARNIFPDQFDSLFLAFLFDSLPFRYQIQKRVGGVKVYSINARNIGSALAWIPPIEEQIEISRYLEQVRSNLDIAIQTKSQIIEELKAYKKSLIWETVTGKREVPCL